MRRPHHETPAMRMALALAAMMSLLGWGCGSGEPVAPSDAVAAMAHSSQGEDFVGATDGSVYGIDEVVLASTRRDAPARENVVTGELPTERATVDVEDRGANGAGGVTGDPYSQGVRLFEEKRYLEAATHLSVAAQEQNSSWYTQYLLGLALWKSGELDGAVESLERSIELKDDFVKTYVNLSRVQNDAGRFESALSAARGAVALAPHDPLARYLEGRSLANLGRSAEALERLEASLRLDPGDGEVENRVGLEHLRQGRFEMALEHLERAVELSPEREYIRNNLGIAYEGVGRLRDAEAQFVAGLDIAGESDRLSTNLARVRRLPDRTVGIARGESDASDLP